MLNFCILQVFCCYCYTLFIKLSIHSHLKIIGYTSQGTEIRLHIRLHVSFVAKLMHAIVVGIEPLTWTNIFCVNFYMR